MGIFDDKLSMFLCIKIFNLTINLYSPQEIKFNDCDFLERRIDLIT
jgi:hypothetical protein